MIDKLMLTLMIVSLIITTHYISYEFGKKHMCEKDKDYVFSYDYSKCVKIGKENMK